MSTKQANTASCIRNDNDIICFGWVEDQIICCFSNKKTYLYSKINDTMRSTILNENVLYSQFLGSKNKIYCARAFGGLDIYRNQQFEKIYEIQENPDNFALQIIEYSDFIFLILKDSIIVFRDEKFEFQYKIPNHMVIYNSSYDKESRFFILAYKTYDKQMISCKKIDNFLNDLLAKAPESKLFQNFHVDYPISCIAIQKGGQKLAIGFFNGKIQVYQYKTKKETYKLELEFSDSILTQNQSFKIYPNNVTFKQNTLAVAWSSTKLGFYDLDYRCESGQTSCKDSIFNFVSFCENEKLLYYSRSKNKQEKSVIQTIQ